MPSPELKAKANQILALLKQEFPDTTPPLHHRNPFELLIATILSAQTTDARVNQVTPLLFAKYPTAQDLAQADIVKVANLIRSMGLYNNKARNIVATAQKLVSNFGGRVPQTLDELITLPGVGRKVATVVLYQAFGKNDGFTVDTHVMRLAQWLGLTQHTDPIKIERDLMQLFPQAEWGTTSLRLVLLGRSLLTARAPKQRGTVWESFVA